jgi:hypothetical protein
VLVLSVPIPIVPLAEDAKAEDEPERGDTVFPVDFFPSE